MFVAILSVLVVMRKFLEKKGKNLNFGAYCFLYRSFFSRFQFTRDLHDALNQENSKSFYFYLNGILL